MDEYMCTYSGQMLRPLELREEDISLEDIAHALSLLCRGGGHLRHFYSVGQHCLNCAREAQARKWSARIVLGCLLHDAGEAYISDIIRPVKRYLPNYMELEDKILTVIYGHFGLGDMDGKEYSRIRQIDNEILENEIPVLMSFQENKEPARLFSSPDFSMQDMANIEERYTCAVNALIETLLAGGGQEEYRGRI